MSSAPEYNLRPALQQDAGPKQALYRARVLDRTALASSEIAYELEGDDYGAIGASVIVVDAPPGSGPKLHKHPSSVSPWAPSSSIN
jgi:hypothetical protein